MFLRSTDRKISLIAKSKEFYSLQANHIIDQTFHAHHYLGILFFEFEKESGKNVIKDYSLPKETNLDFISKKVIPIRSVFPPVIQ